LVYLLRKIHKSDKLWNFETYNQFLFN